MSGHSKWSTIKRKKGANDAKRAQLFAKLIKAIEISARNGGTDPLNNASLFQAISKAKSSSVPNDNIERALKRVEGNSESSDFIELSYEGYGPYGVAILINCLTDNKNRTSSDVKAALAKYGGAMGTPGSVSYLFERKAVFQFESSSELLIDTAISLDCLDVLESSNGVSFEFTPTDFKKAYDGFKIKNFSPINSEIAHIPLTSVKLESSQFQIISKLIETLEDLDDVQDVFTNFDIEEKDLQTLLS